MAVLSVILATTLLMGLGVSSVLLGTSEAVLAAHDRTARAMREASMAAVHLTVADLRRQPSWSAVLGAGVGPVSALPGRLTEVSVTPVPPWGGPLLDLRQSTVDVQAAADTGSGDPQIWRLYEFGPLSRVVPDASVPPLFVAAWVADDPADGDGDPLTDSNGILAVRAEALGPANSRAVTAVSIRKTALPGELAAVRILTIRPRP